MHRIGVHKLDGGSARAGESKYLFEDSIQGIGRDRLIADFLATIGVPSDEAPVLLANGVTYVGIRLEFDQLVVKRADDVFPRIVEERDAIPPACADRGVDIGRVIERPAPAAAEEMHRSVVAAQSGKGGGAVQS